MSEAQDETSSWVAGTIKRALEAGMVEHACEVYEESGAQHADDVLAALRGVPALRDPGAKMFLLARDFGRAARLYEAANLWARAATQYEEAGELGEAARCWHKGGDVARAAPLYDAAGLHQAAVPLYQKLGDHAAAARCLLQSGRPLDAAKLYQKLGNVRGEVDALKAVDNQDLEHPAAVQRLADVLTSRGRPAEATSTIEAALRDGPHARKDAGLHETLALLYEKQGLADHARRVRARLAGAGQRAPLPTPMAVAKVAPRTEGGGAKDGYGFLKAIPLFSRLSMDDMKDLYRLTSEVVFTAGDIVLDTGAEGQGLFVVIEGHVDIVAVLPQGLKKLNTLSAGAYFGEVSLLGKSKTSARVEAVSPVQALHIPVTQFEHFLASKPAAALRVYRLFAENLAERVRALSQR